MQVFTKVVEMNGFACSAEAQGIPHALAATIMQKLEALCLFVSCNGRRATSSCT
ncbi:hypothetical protein [Trinickia mobilis]|uniref:hypothetical protein n=1 Tax=Trinickia mobilis TaxID=2816356 RepID=UPI001A906CE3|nr:hypothetical protein [Trinickia mobilis]